MNKANLQLRTVLWRGMRQQCPQCEKSRVFRGWGYLHDHCSKFGSQYLQDQGDLWAYLVAIDRALFVFSLIVLIYFQRYIPSSARFYALAAGPPAVFIHTLPQRDGLALGFDYLVRRKWGELSEAATPRPPTDQT